MASFVSRRSDKSLPSVVKWRLVQNQYTRNLLMQGCQFGQTIKKLTIESKLPEMF
jgi:hypothetical protein